MKKMTRSCSKCGTEFRERIFKPDVYVIDPIPECYVHDKPNGICVDCCNCNNK